ncbi:SEC-C metal-binding domain-containing protein [Clostridium sp. YIM B02551]|uniref:SEC-C metal-binding domain-containing protein n=1 Tax=Clostridium sp. YIM B02551 TaxID=2910679 RepID=UPI001EEC9E75|nr:SEC-C metal-binding domain-containing protein [Clostridium sp. YIM B02551]
MSNNCMNEATFEAQLNGELKKVFPTLNHLKITHQKVLTLRLGHHIIGLNALERERLYGRSDVLIEYENKPLAIIELKRKGNEITIGDKEQGISYARLITPMPPLVIVTNGDNVKFYKTYDKTELQFKSVDEQTIETLFFDAINCAAKEHDEAVNILLGKQPDIWTKVIKEFTNTVFEGRKGEITDFTYPLIKDISFKRKIVSDLGNLIYSGEKLISLIGPPLSGKTNLLYQLCTSSEFDKIVPLYIDASTTMHGIFKQLAMQFSRTLFKNMSIEEVRQWILTAFRNNVDGQLVIIIDGWSTCAKDEIMKDVEELILLSDNKNITIVLSMDDTTFKQVSYVPSRPTKTELGRRAKQVNLLPIDKEEMESIAEYIFEKYSACFHNGAFHNAEYRHPRILRILLASLYKSGIGTKHERDDGRMSFFSLPSLTDVSVISSCWDKFATDTILRSDMKFLAKAHVLDESNRRMYPELSIMSHGRGHIIWETAESTLGNERLNRLLEQGILERINGPRGKELVLPKTPELLSIAAGYYISQEALRLLSQGQFEQAYDFIIESSFPLPLGDIAAAKALIEISLSNAQAFTDIVYRLLEDEPSESNLGEGSLISADFPGIGIINLHFGEGMNETAIGNYHPWLILSQIACLPIGDENGSRNIHLRILATLGSYSGLLRRPDDLNNYDLEGLHFHDIEGRGSMLCRNVGIVEPITYAIQQGFYSMPEEMLKLCNWAKKNDDFHLMWRILTAAQTTTTCVDEKICKASEQAIRLLDSCNEASKEKCISDERKANDNIEHITKSPIIVGDKIGRNHPCPCKSGKKYKKCCGKS